MSTRFPTGVSRRELLAGTLRHTTLGLLVGLSGSIFAKRQRLVRQGKCANRGVCANCDSFETCVLPQALSAKFTRQKHGGQVENK